MLPFPKFVALLAAAVSVKGLTPERQIQEMKILMSDVNSNLNDYIGLVGKVDIPDVLFNMYAEMATATDDSYTTVFDALDMGVISCMMTNLPWYSSRLEALVATFTDEVVTTAGAATTTTAATTSDINSYSNATISSLESNVSVALNYTSTLTEKNVFTSESTKYPESEANGKSTTSVTDNGIVTFETITCPESEKLSTKTTVAIIAISTETKGSTTVAISQQTENGASRVYLGAGALAGAVAMLL